MFFGIIRPFYGSGKVGARSIVHEEMLRAVRLSKPRWFVVHGHVAFARQLLRQYRFRDKGKRNPRFTFRKTPVMDDVRVLDLYEDVTRSDIPVERRTGQWVQPFHALGDILGFVKTNLSDLPNVRAICDGMLNVPGPIPDTADSPKITTKKSARRGRP